MNPKCGRPHLQHFHTGFKQRGGGALWAEISFSEYFEHIETDWPFFLAATKMSPEEPRGAQGSPEEPRGAQRSPGEPRRAQKSPEKPRGAQRSPGEPRRAQVSPEEPREAQKCPV